MPPVMSDAACLEADFPVGGGIGLLLQNDSPHKDGLLEHLFPGFEKIP